MIKIMIKIMKQLFTGVLTLATVFTTLLIIAVHAAKTQCWTEFAKCVGIVEKVMNDGSIGLTFNEGYMTVEGEDAYCIDINTATVEKMTEFLKTFFTLYPTATEKELAYYVSGNALSPVNCDYGFSKLVNPIFTKTGNKSRYRYQ